MTPTRKIGIGAFLLGSVVGGAIGMNGLASAASNATTPATTVVDSSSTTSGTDTSGTDTSGTDTSGTDTSGTDDATPQPPGPHTANGITEVVLTGDTATSVQAAVLAAQPGATIERMETDAEGAAYEAHVTLADGSHATVKLDASFTVTGTETGFGAGGPHGGGPGHPHDGDADDTTSDATSATS